jgi:hypothetical protein
MKKIVLFYLATLIAVVTSAKPQATPADTIDVVCYDLQLNADFIGLFGMAYIFANNSDYKLTGAILADSIPPGTYTNCMMDLTHIATGKQIPATSVTLNLSVDKNHNCAIVGQMLGEDNILYNLDLSWQTPSTKDTVAIAFENSAWVAYYPDLGHDFMLSNEDENYDIAIDIVQVPMGESFTERNLNIGYCRIANKQTKDTVKIAAAEGRVWQSNDTTYLSAMVTCFDSVMYDINLWYAVPEVVQTVELNTPNATFYNELESDGYYALVGTTTDHKYEFAISLLGDSEEDIPGTYVNDGLFGGFSGKGYDFLHFIGGQYTTYVAKWNAEKKDYDIISIEKGETVVNMDDDQNVSLEGWFVGADGVEYKVTLSTRVDKPRIIDDATEGAVERRFVNEDELVVEKLAEDEVRLEIMTDRDLLAMRFYVEWIDGEIVIPEGEYSIDTSEDYWSVVAADGSLGKTFYATHDGEYFTSFYFLTSGTVKISKKNGKLCFEIDAQNSYDVPVHIVYEASNSTAVENISLQEINNQKKIIDGQLMIIRNEKVYNALGAQIQ